MSTSTIALTAGYLSIIVAISIFVISIGIMKKYLERKKMATILLFFSIITWLVASLAVSIIYFLSEQNINLAMTMQKLVYSCVFIGTIFTYLFFTQIFFRHKNIIKIGYVIVGLIAILIVFIGDSVSVGVFPDGSGYPLLNIKIEYISLVVIYILPTTIWLFLIAWRTAKLIPEKEYQIGYRVIAFGQVFILLTFVSDTLQGIFTDTVGLYALFLYLTWIFPLLAMICYYIGYIMPGWFIKSFKK